MKKNLLGFDCGEYVDKYKKFLQDLEQDCRIDIRPAFVSHDEDNEKLVRHHFYVEMYYPGSDVPACGFAVVQVPLEVYDPDEAWLDTLDKYDIFSEM